MFDLRITSLTRQSLVPACVSVAVCGAGCQAGHVAVRSRVQCLHSDRVAGY